MTSIFTPGLALRVTGWLLAGAVTVSPLLGASSPVFDVGSRKQLFVDQKFIETSEGVSLVMNPPARTGEVLVAPDAPWEKNLEIFSYSSVLKEDGRIRLWYGVRGRHYKPLTNPDFIALAYAESTDGIHFQKPVLNLVEFEGSRANNLVQPTDPSVMSLGGGSVARDENPAAPPAERYKSWIKIYPKKGSGLKGQHRVFTSPDGLHWNVSEQPVTGLRAADTQPSWFWDPRIQRYVGYSREWVQFPGEGRIRMASYNESDDMHTWKTTDIALEPDARDFAGAIRPQVDFGTMQVTGETLVMPGDRPRTTAPDPAHSAELFTDQVPRPGAPGDIYGPGVMPYAEAEGVYISLMSVFHHWSETKGPDTSDVRLGVSRDARHFTQPGGRRPFLSVGPAGSFDSKWLWALPGPVRMGDELWIYYFGLNGNHSLGLDPAASAKQTVISRAVMRLDGFVSADFDYTGGSLITPPLRFQGSRLELNLDTGAGGVGQVEILDESGAPIPGFRLQEADLLNGNNVRFVVSWRGQSDVSSLTGRAVRLHLRLRSAKLYAFQFQ